MLPPRLYRAEESAIIRLYRCALWRRGSETTAAVNNERVFFCQISRGAFPLFIYLFF